MISGRIQCIFATPSDSDQTSKKTLFSIILDFGKCRIIHLLHKRLNLVNSCCSLLLVEETRYMFKIRVPRPILDNKAFIKHFIQIFSRISFLITFILQRCQSFKIPYFYIPQVKRLEVKRVLYRFEIIGFRNIDCGE